MYKPLETAMVGDTLFDLRWGLPTISKLQKIEDNKYLLTLDDGNTYTVDAYGYEAGDSTQRTINVIYRRPVLCKRRGEPEINYVRVYQYSEILPYHEIIGRAND